MAAGDFGTAVAQAVKVEREQADLRLVIMQARTGSNAAPCPFIVAGDSISYTSYAGYAFASALGGFPSGTDTAGVSAGNAAVPGNTSTQLLARFDNDVIAASPALVHILIGTNDAGNSVPVSTFAANIRAMVAKCRAIGARVILGTVPPTSSVTPANRTPLVIAYNAWLVRYALAEGIQVADYYGALVDQANGGYAAAYNSGDGVHPSPAGIGVMAAELAASKTRPSSAELLLPKDNADPWNYVVNGLFTNPLTTGWSQGGTHTNVASTIESDANIPGSWAKMAAASSGALANYNQARSASQGGTAYAAGNWTVLVGRVKVTALQTGQYWSVRDKFVNVLTQYLGTAQNRFTVPMSSGGSLVVGSAASAASVSNQIVFELSGGTGDLWVAQLGVYDLTAMGVTDTAGALV